MSRLVVVSLLSLLAYFFADKKWTYLFISGAAAGAAQLTKSSSALLIPVIAILFMLNCWAHRHVDPPKGFLLTLVQLAAWAGILALVYVLLWPGIWVAPGKMLYEAFGNAFSYAMQGARLSAATSGAPATLQPKLGDVAPYVQSVLWRTTAVVWIGAALGLASIWRQHHIQRIVLLFLILVGALFVVLFGLASGRNSAHYVLTSYVVSDILAGAGFVAAATWLEGQQAKAVTGALAVLFFGAAIAIQAAGAAPFFPYYYTYYHPIMEARAPGLQDPNFGYGEGLDLAAAYLRQMPAAAESTVMAFYGREPFSYFYPGTPEPLKTVYGDAENVPQLQQVLRKSDYLVIYYALEKGRDAPPNVMRALQAAAPEKSIWMDGIDYIRIYSLKTMPSDFFDQLAP